MFFIGDNDKAGNHPAMMSPFMVGKCKMPQCVRKLLNVWELMSVLARYQKVRGIGHFPESERYLVVTKEAVVLPVRDRLKLVGDNRSSTMYPVILPDLKSPSGGWRGSLKLKTALYPKANIVGSSGSDYVKDPDEDTYDKDKLPLFPHSYTS